VTNSRLDKHRNCVGSEVISVRRHENGSPPPKEDGLGVVARRSTTPSPSLSKEGNQVAVFMHRAELKDNEAFAAAYRRMGVTHTGLPVLGCIMQDAMKLKLEQRGD